MKGTLRPPLIRKITRLSMAKLIFTLLVSLSHLIVAGAGPANFPPTLRVLEPADNLTLYSLSNYVIVRAEATDPDGNIAEVRLFENGKIIGSDFQPPYEFLYKATGFGSYTLHIQAVDNLGLLTAQIRTVEYVRVDDNFSPGLAPKSGTNLTLRGTTLGATRQKDEPNHGGVAGGKSIWWAWRAPYSGTVNIDTIGSDFDTVLGVYTNRLGQSPGPLHTLAVVAANDDDSAAAPLSRVKFHAVAGRTYFIAVDGRDGFAGNVVLNISQARARAEVHDFIDFARSIPSTTIQMSSNVGASKEPGEPDHAGNPGGASLWWRIDSRSGSPIQISTSGSNFDTVLAVYTNVAFSPREQNLVEPENLRLVVANDDSGSSTNRTSLVEFTPTTSTSYWVAVDGYNGAEGNIRLTVSVQQQTPRPTNDMFHAATVLSGSAALTKVDTSIATSEGREPSIVPGQVSGRSVWYRWVAPATGPVYLSTKGSHFDTLLGVFTGADINNLHLIAGNDDDGGLLTSSLAFHAIAGTEYRIVVAGYQMAGGELVLLLNQPPLLLPRIITQLTGRGLSVGAEQLTGPAVIETSSDLANWRPIGQIDEQNRSLDIESGARGSQGFFRIRTLE